MRNSKNCEIKENKQHQVHLRGPLAEKRNNMVDVIDDWLEAEEDVAVQYSKPRVLTSYINALFLYTDQ